MNRLLAGLIVSSFAFASASAIAQSPPTQPIQTTGVGFVSKMSTEEAKAARAEAKAKWETLTPEQKAAYKSAASKKKREELTAMEEVASETGPVYDTKKAAEEAKASKAQPLPTKQERQADLKKAEEASAKASGSKSGVPQQ